MSTPKSVIDNAKKSGAKLGDVKFVDTFGTWQHFSVSDQRQPQTQRAQCAAFASASL
jgi:hypothetical protein